MPAGRLLTPAMRESLAPLALREYRLLFTAQAVSLLGSWMTPVALAFAVLELTDSATAVGIVLGAELVPLAGLLLVGGVWGDRLARARLMVLSDVASAAAQATGAVLLLTGTAEVWHLVVVAAAAGAADAFHTPAWTGLLAETVPPSLLQRANALRHLESNVMRVAGPVAAGLLIALAGPGLAIAADAASFLAAAVVLARMRIGWTRPPARPAEEAGFRRELVAGLREVTSRVWLLAMLLDTALWVLFIWGPYAVLGPVVADRELGGATAWAAISAAYGVGAVAGGLIGLRLEPRRPLLAAVVTNAAFAPLLALLAVEAPVPLLAVVALPAGASVSLYMVLWDTAVQRRVPAAALSRVASTERAATYALMPAGMALAGPVAGAVGIDVTLWAGVAWLVASTAFLLAVPGIRGFRYAPDPVAGAS
jgi:MFS family permease